MPSKCTFKFERPQQVYFTGETVNGRIILETTSQKSVRDISIYFEGIGRTYWTEEKQYTGRESRWQTFFEQFRGNECYISTKSLVSGEGVLPPGTHIYTFSIPIPPDCPSSRVEKYGRIYYEIKLKLIRHYKYDNIFSQSLTVLHPTNINLDPQYLIPLICEDIKTFCCWPCASEPVISTLTIPYSAYAPGQDINFKLEIDNQTTGYDMGEVKVKLSQTITFVAHYPYEKKREYKNDLAVIEDYNHCLRLSKRVFEGKLRVPDVPPTTSDNGIIKVEYLIRVEIEQNGFCSSNPKIVVPITIGSVEHCETQPDNVITIEPTASNKPGTPAFPPSYEFCTPPSFEYAIGSGDPDFVDPHLDPNAPRQSSWVARYPMYSNFAVPQYEAERPKLNELLPLSNTAQLPTVSEVNGSSVVPFPKMKLE